MLELWSSIARRFPGDVRPLRFEVRWLVRQGQHELAYERICQFRPTDGTDYSTRLARCGLLTVLRDVQPSLQEYGRLLADYPDQTSLRIQYGKRLHACGYYQRAWDVLAPLQGRKSLAPAVVELLQSLRSSLDVMDRLYPSHIASTESTSTLALQFLIDEFADRKLPPGTPGVLGNITLLTGTLGPGGAERQMTNTAVRLQKAKASNELINGCRVEGEVTVVVKSYGKVNECDFYLPTLRAAGIGADQLDTMDTFSLSELGLPGHHLEELAPLLPSQATFGLERLITYFRANKVATAYIWQDGCVLMSALAALYAGVPRIVFSLRGQPPNLRRHMYREEYFAMYVALSKVPGVYFSCNSAATAKQYAEWLGIAPERFAVVPNGIDTLPCAGSELEQALWNSFEANTLGASRTIGGVFRHILDKRPLLWIRMAKAVLDQDPRARFVLVGSGPLSDEVRKLLLQNGIAERVLLVGRSVNVGFWMSKFDAIVSTSKFEGLPNVLIEAQLCGVPVVSTRAGGSSETFIEGQTGASLDMDPETLSQTVNTILMVSEWHMTRPELSEVIKKNVAERFSIQRMIERTMLVVCDSPHS